MNEIVVNVIADEIRNVSSSIWMAEEMLRGLRNSVCVAETQLARHIARKDVLREALRIEAPKALEALGG